MRPHNEHASSSTLLSTRVVGLALNAKEGWAMLGDNSHTSGLAGPSAAGKSGKSPGCEMVRTRSEQTVGQLLKLGTNTYRIRSSYLRSMC